MLTALVSRDLLCFAPNSRNHMTLHAAVVCAVVVAAADIKNIVAAATQNNDNDMNMQGLDQF
jgi:hypothetical protein